MNEPTGPFATIDSGLIDTEAWTLGYPIYGPSDPGGLESYSASPFAPPHYSSAYPILPAQSHYVSHPGPSTSAAGSAALHDTFESPYFPSNGLVTNAAQDHILAPVDDRQRYVPAASDLQQQNHLSRPPHPSSQPSPLHPASSSSARLREPDAVVFNNGNGAKREQEENGSGLSALKRQRSNVCHTPPCCSNVHYVVVLTFMRFPSHPLRHAIPVFLVKRGANSLASFAASKNLETRHRFWSRWILSPSVYLSTLISLSARWTWGR
jgi:hypothetical protein